jgi:hypothetical protein
MYYSNTQFFQLMNPPIFGEWIKNKVGFILYPLLNFVVLFFQIFLDIGHQYLWK